MQRKQHLLTINTRIGLYNWMRYYSQHRQVRSKSNSRLLVIAMLPYKYTKCVFIRTRKQICPMLENGRSSTRNSYSNLSVFYPLFYPLILCKSAKIWIFTHDARIKQFLGVEHGIDSNSNSAAFMRFFVFAYLDVLVKLFSSISVVTDKRSSTRCASLRQITRRLEI